MFPFPGWDATAPDERLFSEKFLRKIEQSGDRQKYARTLAYVALHSRNDEQAVHAAEKAIALDPRFTWICARVSHATYLMPGYDPHPWIERLKAWDPQNALPYLLEASASTYGNWETRWSRYNAATPDLRRALAAEPSWRGPMEKAFAAERIDLYESQLFELNRQVLQEQGLDRPDLLMVAGLARPKLDLVSVQSFTDFLVKDVGESAEKAGRPGEALAAYWTVVRFWERLNAGTDYLSRWHIEKARREPYQQLTALLRREGRADEAATIEAALTPFPDDELIRERERAPGESVAKRAARIVLISGVFLAVFAMVSLVWIISILILRWSPSFSRAMNRVASVLCFSPAALLLAALTFFLGFYPYAQPMKRFASAHEVTAAYSPFLHSLWISLGYISDIWFSDMFWPSIWCVVVALLGALALRWAAHRKRTDRTGAA